MCSSVLRTPGALLVLKRPPFEFERAEKLNWRQHLYLTAYVGRVWRLSASLQLSSACPDPCVVAACRFLDVSTGFGMPIGRLPVVRQLAAGRSACESGYAEWRCLGMLPIVAMGNTLIALER